MGKLFGGVVALTLAATGSLALAAPGSTQEEPPIELQHLDATLSPGEVAPGDDVTVTPEENCSAETGVLVWVVYEAGEFNWDTPDFEIEPVMSDAVELADDGSWEVVFPAPDGADPDPGDEAFQALAEDEEEPFVVEVYGPEAFQVGDTAYEWFAECVELTLPELVHLDADLSQVGDDVTVTPVDNCSLDEGSLFWSVYRAGEFSWDDIFGDAEPVLAGSAPLAGDGSWQVELSAADIAEGPFDELAAAEEEPEEPFVLEVYGPEAFEVDGTAYEWFADCSEDTELPILQAEITSHPPHVDLGVPFVQQGEQMTVEPIDACPVTGPDDTVFWEIDTWPVEGDSELVDAGYLDLADDGTWKLDFPTRDDHDVDAAEFYVIWLDCESPDELTAFYDPLFFGVGDFPETPPAEEPTEPVGPKPARPIVREPDQTG